MVNLNVVFASLYIIVDIIYVTLSKGVYETVAARIQGNGFPPLTISRAFGAVFAYVMMFVAWYLLVAPAALAWSKRMHPALAGAAAGMVFGALLYGVFNGSLHAMFKNYDVPIVLRDFLWGTTWATVLTASYAVYASNNYSV